MKVGQVSHEVPVEIPLEDLGLLVGDELQDDVVHVPDCRAAVLAQLEVPKVHHLLLCLVYVSDLGQSALVGFPHPGKVPEDLSLGTREDGFLLLLRLE